MSQEVKGVRLIDERGRITLPISARRSLDWSEQTPLEVWVSPQDEQMVIRRYKSTCCFCSATENLKEFSDKYICPSCQERISKL